MPTFKVVIAYDGTDFAGWQTQPDRRTVQGAVEQALSRITKSDVRVVASGRTDAGVHALGQVIGFSADTQISEEALPRALNAGLPHDVAALHAEIVDDDFHPIRSAIRKRYRYVIHDGPTRDVINRRLHWHVFERLDAEVMNRAAQSLSGKHDFASFETQGAPRESTVRTIFDINVARPDPTSQMIHIEVEADGFLYNMVRAIVGTLVEVGRHARDESWPAEVVAATNRSAAGQTAPPQGLFLLQVDY